MFFDDLSGNVQAESNTLVNHRSFADTEKTLEQLIDIRGRNSNSKILDPNFNISGFNLGFDKHFASIRRILDSIIQKVDQYLLDPELVAVI